MSVKTNNPDHENFRDSHELRDLLYRLHHAGDHAWEHDPAAAELMEFTRDKYAPLARRHDPDPWAGSIAFAKKIDAERESMPVEQRGRQLIAENTYARSVRLSMGAGLLGMGRAPLFHALLPH